MKLLFKAFIQKQLKTVSLLVFLSFLVLVSIQVTTTIWTKDLTLVNRINQVNGAHTYILTPERYSQSDEQLSFGMIGLGSKRISAILDQYQLTTRRQLNVDMSYAFPFVNDDREYDIFVMGYTSDNETNQYEVIKGKALSELSDYEVAISESYARQLTKEGKDPLASTIQFDVQNETITFTIVSIIDFVNFNDAYVSDKGLKEIPLFDFPFKSVALGNFDTLRQLGSLYPFYSREVMQVRFEDYSRRGEESLVKQLLDSHNMDVTQEKIIASYEITDYLSTNDLLYKHVSMFSLFGLLISTAYSFIVFIKRQLKQNAANLGLMSIVGLEHKKIERVFQARLGVVFALAFILFAILNIVVGIMFYQDRSLANVFDLNSIIFTISMIASLVYFIVIGITYTYQIKKMIKQSLTSMKTKQQAFIKNPQTKRKTLPVIIAFKSLFAHKGFFVSSLLVVSVVMFTLFSNVFITHQMGHIYNEDTLGVQFDYIVQDAPFAHWEFTNEYASDQVMVDKLSDLYFVDIHFSEYVRTYYKGNMLIFWTLIEPFTEVVEGDYPPDWRQIYSEFPENYRFTLASRKHMDTRDAYVYSEENLANYGQPERGYLFYAMPQYSYSSHETAATISGTVNTLIDNGWIMYVYRKRQMIEVGVPYLNMYLLNMKDDVDPSTFELAMDEQNITYTSYGDVLNMLNNANQENQNQIFYFMSFMLGILVIVLLINIVAYTLIQSMESHDDNKLYKQIGIQPMTYRKIFFNQYLIYAIGIVIVTQLALWIGYPIVFDGVLRAYGLYYTIDLPPLFSNSALILLGVLVVLLVLSNIGNEKTQ